MAKIHYVDLDFGAVIVHCNGRVTVKEGVSLDEASKAFWARVVEMLPNARSVPSKNVVEILKELAGCFDVGCSIHMGEDDITVEGHDYHESDTKMDGSVLVVRTYSADYEHVMNENGEGYKDTLTPLIKQIKAGQRVQPSWLRPGCRVQKNDEALDVRTRRRRGKLLAEPVSVEGQSHSVVQWDGDFVPTLFRTELLEKEQSDGDDGKGRVSGGGEAGRSGN